MEDLKNEVFIEILDGILENPYIGIILVDTLGRISKVNKTYLEILGLKEEDVLNKHILEVTPHSRLPEVLRTRGVHLADYWPVNGHDTIVFRMPLYKDEKLIGAMGQSLVLGAAGAKILSKKLKELERELTVYKDVVSCIYSSKYCFNNIVGEDETIRNVKSIAQRASNTGSTVLIMGESGTGKELFANAIHQASPRKDRPFVRVNCAALPDNLLESELFGYEEGAFTGARKGGKLGKFEIANHGTIFLDEIGDMPLAMQAKLLIVLQEREVERVGGTKPIRVDVQVIAATNRNLEEMMKKGTFREDLYYRLNVVTLNVPSLRKRPRDIYLLINYLLPKLNQRLHTQVENVSEEALQLLCSYDWPGNVRELENLLERAINLADLNQDSCLTPEFFPSLSRTVLRPVPSIEPISVKSVDNLGEAVGKLEEETIRRVLQNTYNNKAQTAKILGLNKSVLYRKLRKYNLISDY
ncbi:sigma 54-interacting transcriptional regulator [Desulfosporosinus sp. Sb-LF]|uniref:sigma-54 interaction domain-containing protein n=1 Tax=Desulfosporosinus sp. Sb-LF TaxID=2560027 RepID=UPI00107F34D4|nr:sigma 54-interacting transcriptional regulator [Desulfosporosinus sp. Sb-LF]TGE31667.1 PAS domain S-box protein [Desulfosporosinus sp. Sb-LF]